MSAEIAAAGGTVEKFIGDAVVAVVRRASCSRGPCSPGTRSRRSRCRQEWRTCSRERWSFEIGVNTGEVVVGGASEGSFATGDTMNVAARLEQAASPRQVLAGERTAAAVAQAFVFGDAMVVEAKGKPGGVACRPVLGVAPSVVSRVVATPHVFVGRQSDLEALRAAYNQVCSHASVQLVTIIGDPGIGKSALLGQFWEDLGEAIPQPIKLVGRCLAYGRGITFWAFRKS